MTMYGDYNGCKNLEKQDEISISAIIHLLIKY